MAITGDSAVSPFSGLLEAWGENRVYENYPTWADLSAESATLGKLAIVDAIPGAWFLGTGSTWVMHGVARFADESARSSAIASPVAGMQSRRTDATYDEEYVSSAWRPMVASALMLPTSVTGGSIAADKGVSSSSVALVRANGVFGSVFPRYKVNFDITSASSTTVNALLSASGSDTGSGYDNQRHTDVGSSATSAQSLNLSVLMLNGGVASTRVVGVIYFDTNPNAAAETYFRVEATVSPNPMTASYGMYRGGGLQRGSTQFDGISFAAASGNITVNRLSIVGEF